MIELEDVWKVFGTDEQAVLAEARRPVPDDAVLKRLRAVIGVGGASLSVEKGELVCLMGLSGSGKSTLVRLINRLLEPSAGKVRIDGGDILSLGPRALRELRSRRIGMVFQSHALLAHLSVRDNVALPLEIRGVARTRREDRADELLVRVGLDGLGDRRVAALSGGMQQRVGLARALAADPDILLMDEPFSALDPITRGALQAEMAAIHKATGTTIVFVTHDMDEALALASRIAVLDRGRLVQTGTPLDILTHPADDRVRDLVGREDWGLKRLAVETVAERTRPGETAPGDPLAAGASLRQALAAMVACGTDRLPVADGQGRPMGALHLADLLRGPDRA